MRGTQIYPQFAVETKAHLCQLLNVGECELDAILANTVRQFRKREKVMQSGKVRVLYNPSAGLRRVQRGIKAWLDSYPMHDAVHGWRRGRSIRTNGEVHVEQPYVAVLDIDGFFPSTSYGRVRTLFATLGCSQEVAAILTKLVTADGSLAQGFVSSPVVANIILSPLHMRVGHLCELYNVVYTQYGDDLTFSGGVAVEKVLPIVRDIVKQMGYRINEAKFSTKGICSQEEQQVVCGVVVNKRVTATKEYVRETRRLLKECVTTGCAVVGERTGRGKRLREHLFGRVQFVHYLDPKAAWYLRHLYRKVDWSAIYAL